MVELLQDCYFPECTLRVCCVLKGIKDLLEGEQSLGPDVLDFPDVAVCPAADLLFNVEPTEDVGLNILG